MALLGLATVLVMLGVAYVYYQEGLVASFAAAVTALISSMVAFQFWPYIANELESALRGTFLTNCEDALVLTALFAVPFALMRLATVHVVSYEIGYGNAINRVGGAVFGLITGYIVAGFLLCVVQTLPIPHDFLGFQTPPEQRFDSRFLPADQNVLKLMDRCHRGAYSARPIGPEESSTFQMFTFDFGAIRRAAPSTAPQPTPEQQPPDGNKAPKKPKEKKERPKEKDKIEEPIKKDEE